MKRHAAYLLTIAVLVTALGWTCTAFEQRKSGWEAKEDSLHKDLTAANDKAERWRVTATALQGQTHTQKTLVEACLQREASLWEDMQSRKEGMALAPPVPISKEQQTWGVSRETRRAFVNALNAPLE